MSSQARVINRRGLFGLLGTGLLVGVGASLVIRDVNSYDDGRVPVDASDTPYDVPEGEPGDPHILDPALDEGPEPGALTSEMAARLADATDAAAAEGIELTVTSGWRSAAYQQDLFLAAVEENGSEEAARQWVLPPDESMHVRGLAVDVGPPGAAAWLAANGWQFGLCQRYENEPWHFEPITSPGGDCPAMRPNSAAA